MWLSLRSAGSCCGCGTHGTDSLACCDRGMRSFLWKAGNPQPLQQRFSLTRTTGESSVQIKHQPIGPDVQSEGSAFLTAALNRGKICCGALVCHVCKQLNPTYLRGGAKGHSPPASNWSHCCRRCTGLRKERNKAFFHLTHRSYQRLTGVAKTPNPTGKGSGRDHV